MENTLLYEEIGRRVKKFREIRRMTQDELAIAVMVSQSSIARLETGHTMVSVYTLVEIAKILDVPIAELLFERESAGSDELTRLADKLNGCPLEERQRLIRCFEELADIFMQKYSRTK